jgi:thioredoxin 1
MPPETPLTVICLCADWCGTCRDFGAVFEALQTAWPGHRFAWVDIEDDADAVGDLDIETFPTLAVSAGCELLFAGPVLPRLADGQRLLDSLVTGQRDGAAPPASRLASDLKQVFEGIVRTVQRRAG